MQEVIQQVLSYLRGFWRYRWAAMGFAWLLALGAWAYVYQIPDQYRASARIHVDTESMLKPLLRGLAVDSDTQREVQLMTRTLLARPNLEKIARATDLDLQAENPEQMENLLDSLERRIQLEGSGRTNLYRVSYTDTDPQQAKSVVQAVVTLFVEQSLGKSRQDTESAQEFLERKIKEYEARLERAEERLMAFKRKHAGEMPGEQGGYYNRLQSKKAQLEDARFKLETARQRMSELEKQLEGEQPVFGIMGPAASGGQGPGVQTPQLDQRIDKLRQRLDQLLLSYTDKHPQVVSLRDTLNRLKARREEKRQELAQQAEPSAQQSASVDQNPVYQEIKASLAQARADVSAAKSRVRQYRKQVKGLQSKVDTIPKVETKLKQLNRDYEATRQTYQKLLARRQSAEISGEVESSGKQVKFKVVDPPRVPSDPVAPDRSLLVTAGFGASIAGGGALGVFFSLLWPTFFTRSSLYEATGIPVLGAIHRMRTPGHRRKRLLELMAYGVGGLFLVAAFLAVLLLLPQRGAILETARSLIQGILSAGGLS
ncbi:XrtA system polysaccharide chain length determinant [Thiohalorhabdus sp.]|uniref:XrtA system polysaccharide chain length determinant n=1 Tax=Thiohalorhabdus sp. TaxID=3094134 RepID=UPI002FC33CDE